MNAKFLVEAPELEYQVVGEAEDFSEYQLLYEETDQSSVDVVRIPSWDGTIEEQRFRRIGKPNAKLRLRIATFKLSAKDAK